MTRNTLSRRALLAYATLLMVGRRSMGADKRDKPTLAGTWEKKDAETKLEFSADGALTIYPHGDNVKLQLGCSYTVTSAGLVKARIDSIDGPEKIVEHVKTVLPIGVAFQFKWKSENETATLEDVTGKDVEPMKDRLEGDYAKKA